MERGGGAAARNGCCLLFTTFAHPCYCTGVVQVREVSLQLRLSFLGAVATRGNSVGLEFTRHRDAAANDPLHRSWL